MADYAEPPIADPGSLEALLSSFGSTSAPLPPAAPLNVVASQPMAPPPMPPAPLPMPPVNHGIDWKQLIDFVGPLAGLIASGSQAHRTGFATGWTQAHAEAEQQRAQKLQQDLKLREAGANYAMQIADQARSIQDPAEYQQFIDLADLHGAQAGYTQPGELKARLQFPASRLDAAKNREIKDELDQYERNGYNLDDLAQSNAHLTLKDGTTIPFSTALDMTRRRPLGSDNAPIVKPEKVGNTEEERFVAQWAKDNGKTPGKLSATDDLTARTLFRNAGRADKSVAAGGVDAQFNDLIDLWKQGHPGQEPPLAVRTQLRTQANKVNDKAPTGLGADSANGLDPDGIDYAATQYRITGKIPPLGMGSASARAAIINNAAKQAKTLGQSPAAAIQKQAAYSADANALKKMRAASSAAESFETKALAQADIVEGLSNKVARTQYPILNNALLAGEKNIAGDQNTQLLYNALSTFTSEYAKIMEGSTGSAAASSDSARKAAASLISAGLNKGTLSATLDLMRREMRLTIDGYGATINHITDRMGGAPPPDAAAQHGRVYYNSNGQPIKKQ